MFSRSLHFFFFYPSSVHKNETSILNCKKKKINLILNIIIKIKKCCPKKCIIFSKQMFLVFYVLNNTVLVLYECAFCCMTCKTGRRNFVKKKKRKLMKLYPRHILLIINTDIIQIDYFNVTQKYL